MTERITDRDVSRAFRALNSALCNVHGSNMSLVLHVGNSQYKITNKLIVTLPRRDHNGQPTGGTVSTQVWPDTVAGYTKREAYNALRLMTSALGLTE